MAKAAKAPVSEEEMDDAVATPEAPPAEEPKPPKEKKAKKEKPEKADKKEKKDKKAKGGDEKKGSALKFIIPLILLLLIGGLAVFIYFNPLGLRDKYLGGVLRNIPIVNNLVTEPEEAEPQASAEELRAQVAGLQRGNDAKDAEIQRLEDTNKALTAEVRRLTEIEQYQTEVKAEKAALDETVALGDPAGYQAYYEQIDPANAAELYKQVVGITAANKDWKNYVNTFAKMDEGDAAKVLEAMVATNMNTVTAILKDLPVDQRGAILGKITPEVAANIVTMMNPA